MDDLEWFSQLNTDKRVMEFFPTTLSKEQTAEMIQNLMDHYNRYNFTYFACEILDTKEPIGCVGLKHQSYASPFNPAIDIGWRLKVSAWGFGYGTEAAQRCMDYAFNQLKLDRVIAVCTLNNFRSERIMQKIGMHRKEPFDHSQLTDFPNYQRCIYYEKLNSD